MAILISASQATAMESAFPTAQVQSTTSLILKTATANKTTTALLITAKTLFVSGRNNPGM